MAQINKAYWVDDCIISSLGFSTDENISNINNYIANVSKLNEKDIACLIDKKQLQCELEEYGINGYTPCVSLAALALKKINAKFSESTLLVISTTKGDIAELNNNPDNTFLGNISEALKEIFEMPNTPVIISNACISGISALIYGSRLINSGQYKDIYIVGIDILSQFIIEGFKSFKSLSPTICTPYSIDRVGLTLGEGCASVHISSDTITDTVIVKGAISNDANHISGPSRTGDGLHYAIEGAIDKALNRKDLMFINMHGTATPFNDEMESKAINMSNLLDFPINSYKGYLGHTLGASGVIECIISKHALQNNIVYATKGFSGLGVPYPIKVNNTHTQGKGEWCLKTASGFGGCNAAITLCKTGYIADKVLDANYRDINTICRGTVSIANNDEIFADYIRSQYKELGLQDIKFSKMDNLCKLAYIGAKKLLTNIGINYKEGAVPPQRVAMVFANRSSSLDSDIKHNDIVKLNSVLGASPAVFVYTLPNITMGEIAIREKIMGENTFFVFNSKNINFVENYADYLLKNNIADSVIYGWCDYLNGKYDLELKIKEIDNGKS